MSHWGITGKVWPAAPSNPSGPTIQLRRLSGCEFQGYTWVFKGRAKCNRHLDHRLILFAIY